MQQFFSLLSWRLFTAQHVSGVFPPILRSSVIAVAASGFNFVSWWQSCCVRGRACSRAIIRSINYGPETNVMWSCLSLPSGPTGVVAITTRILLTGTGHDPPESWFLTHQWRSSWCEKNLLTLRRRIKSHLLFAGIIRSSPFSPR